MGDRANKRAADDRWSERKKRAVVSVILLDGRHRSRVDEE